MFVRLFTRLTRLARSLSWLIILLVAVIHDGWSSPKQASIRWSPTNTGTGPGFMEIASHHDNSDVYNHPGVSRRCFCFFFEHLHKMGRWRIFLIFYLLWDEQKYICEQTRNEPRNPGQRPQKIKLPIAWGWLRVWEWCVVFCPRNRVTEPQGWNPRTSEPGLERL